MNLPDLSCHAPVENTDCTILTPKYVIATVTIVPLPPINLKGFRNSTINYYVLYLGDQCQCI